MTFARPLISVLQNRIKSDLDSRIDPAAEPTLRHDIITKLGAMQTGVAHGIYGNLDYLSKNLLPDSKDEAILAVWAAIYNVPRLSASVAAGLVEFTGTTGAIVPAGTLLQSSQSVQYSVDADAAIVDGSATASITSIATGAIANQLTGATLNLLAPLAGVNASVVVNVGAITGGADIETIERWSARLQQRIQNPPQGGSPADYKSWALAAHPAVAEAWVTSHEGGAIGTVTVRIVTYDDPAGDIPAVDGTIVTTVFNYIQQKRPAGGLLQVMPPVIQLVDITLAIKPNTVAIRTAAELALHELFRREARPGTIDTSTGEMLGSIPMTHITEAISPVEGETDHQIHSISPLSPISVGRMLMLGTITWAVWQV